jgi:hypothetical protein
VRSGGDLEKNRELSCDFRDQILSQSSVMAFADKYQRMQLSPHTLRRWFHDLILFTEYVKFKAMATGRVAQLDSSYTDMLVCQRSMFSQITHAMTRRRQTISRTDVRGLTIKDVSQSSTEADLRHTGGRLVLIDRASLRSAIARIMERIQGMLPRLRSTHGYLDRTELLWLNNAFIVCIQVVGVPMRSRQRCSMTLSDLSRMESNRGVWITDTAKDSQGSSVPEASAHTPDSLALMATYRDHVRPAIIRRYPHLAGKVQDKLFVSARGPCSSLYGATRALFQEYLPAFHVTPQSIRKFWDTVANEEINDPEQRKQVYRSFGHDEATAQKYYVFHNINERAAESGTTFADRLAGVLTDPGQTQQMLGAK